MSRLSGSRPPGPPDSLPSAPAGAQSDPLPKDPGGTAPLSRRRAPAAGGAGGRSLAAGVRRAAAILVVGCAAIFGAGTAAAQSLTSDPNDDGRTGDDNAYAIDDVIEATVTFTSAVDITGTPQLTLLFGTAEKTANCAAATNTMAMVCSYTVVEDDTASAGVGIKGNTLALNGGTIRNTGTTVDAILFNTGLAAQSGHKVDGIRPTLVTTGPNAPRTSTDGTKVILTFSEDIGSVTSALASISGTTVEVTVPEFLTFQFGELVTFSIAPDGVRDSAGNGIAQVLFQSVANEVPRPPAVITMVEITSAPGSDAIYSTGDAIEVTATFDRAVAVTGKPRIRLRLTGRAAGDRWAEYESGSGSTELVFSYTVRSSDESGPNGIAVGGNTSGEIDLNGGTIKVDEPGGADASLTYSPLLRDSGHRVNWALPTLTSAATSVDGTKIFLTFSETLDSKIVNTNVFTVTVDGTAATLSVAAAVSGVTVTLTLSTALTSSTQSVVVSYDATGSSILDLALNPVANFSNQAVTNRFGATVNVSAIALTSNPNDDGRTGDDNTYAVGDTVAATVTFDGAVDITGTPQLPLLLGGTEKNADCAAATNTTTMVCSYEVAANDAAPAGVAIRANTLALNGGTIRAAGSTTSDASLTHTGAAAQAAHKVDGVKPTLVATGSNAPRTSADGTKAVLTFSEDIGSVDRTRITLIKTLLSATSTLATIAASTSGDTVEITLTSALTSSDTSVTVELAAGAVDDLAGNGNAAVAETAVTTADNTAPTLTGASTFQNDTVVLSYDEALDLTSQPAESAFTVEVGGVARPVTMVSFSGNRRVNLVLGSAFRPGDTLTVSYEAPGTGPLRDEASNPAAAFSDHPVTNEVPATVPDAPSSLAATPGDGSVTLRWTASAYDGGSEVTSHQYRRKTTGDFGSWQDIELSAPGEANATSYPVTSLMNDTAYTFEVQARNAEGESGPSNQASATPVAGDSTAPMLRSATTTALALGLTYDENLDASSEPAPSAFAVTVDGASRAVTGVALDETKVLLTLAPAVRAGETVTVSYTVPAMNPLRDEASNPAAAFSDHPVTNIVPATATVPDAPSSLAATPGDGSVTLRWTASAYDGGSEVTGHQYCREEGPSASCTAESDWRDIAESAPGGANATGYTVTDLTNGTGYTFRVRARNTEGESGPSPEAGTTPDGAAISPGLVRALSAGFGRMVGSQALSMVSAHLEGGGGTQVTVGGERLGGPAAASLGRLAAASRDGDEGGRTRAGREALLGSSFRLQSGGKETGAAGAAAWGRIAAGRFETRSDGVATEGEVTTGMVGADLSSGRWLAGGALSHARGKGSFATSAERAEGESEVRLTTVHPYARVRLGERMSAWGLAGYGKGELALSATGGERVATGLRMWMGAVGARGTVVPAPAGGGFELALKTDALWMRVISEAAEGLPGERADARRVRLVLDASRVVETAGGATLTPRFEVGVRRDGGDTQRGAGLEVGAGLRYARSAVTVEGRVRALALHEASGYEEWGASGSVRVEPSASGRGLSLTLAPTWGDAASAVERLWSLRDAGGLAANADFEPRARLDAELGYGLRGPRGVGVATPYAGLGLAREEERAWRAGARWNLAPNFTLGLEATRREPSANGPPEHRLMLHGALRW